MAIASQRAVAVEDKENIVMRFRDRLWRTLARIVVIEDPWIIKKSKTRREAYYFARNRLAKIDKTLYEKFKTKEAYKYFTQDFLDRLEAWGVIEKPPADPIGFFIVEGVEHAIEEINNYIDKLKEFKGIIYVEKRSAALRLAPLSEIGFIILAGKGFPTRLMREFAKKGRLFVYHDADKSGNDIYRVFSEGAKRLKRIDISYAMRWIVPHAKDVGLFYEDAVKLGVEPEPEARGRQGKRYELEALYAKLRQDYGIENGHIAYVSYQLEKKYGIDLKPKVIDPKEMYARKAEMLLSLVIDITLAEIVRKKSGEVIDSVYQGGQAILDGYKLREDILKKITYESLAELSRVLVKSPPAIEIRPWDLTIIIGGIEGFVDEKDFEIKFKEKYGVNKMYELLG